MLFPELSTLVIGHAAAANAADRPPPPPTAWMLPVVSVAAAIAWYMHWRWRRGRYFTSRFTTAEREAAKWAVFGPVLLPCAIGCNRVDSAARPLGRLGLPTNAWYGRLLTERWPGVSVRAKIA